MRADLRAVDHVVKSKRRRIPGAALKAAREKAGLSQADLAVILELRLPTISERENAPNGVSWETWVSWAWACGIDPLKVGAPGSSS